MLLIVLSILPALQLVKAQSSSSEDAERLFLPFIQHGEQNNATSGSSIPIEGANESESDNENGTGEIEDSEAVENVFPPDPADTALLDSGSNQVFLPAVHGAAQDSPAVTTAAQDLLFADGFESGNLSGWTASATDGGNLSPSTAAALVGTYGLSAVINDNISLYVTDDRPLAEPRYRARFYFDPSSIGMASGSRHYIFYGYAGTSTVVLRVDFRFSSGSYQLRAGLRNDSSSWKNSSWYNISDASHFVELDWQAAAAGASNGSLVW
jgi:hypothetical protein